MALLQDLRVEAGRHHGHADRECAAHEPCAHLIEAVNEVIADHADERRENRENCAGHRAHQHGHRRRGGVQRLAGENDVRDEDAEIDQRGEADHGQRTIGETDREE